MKLLLAALLLAATSAAAFAQSSVKIEGYVFNDDGLPLKGANVVLEGTALGTTTNEAGYFRFENLFAGEYTVVVSYLGFQSQLREDVQVNKTDKVSLTFHLQPAVIPLAELVVQARRVVEAQRPSTEVLSRETIENSSATSVGEILVSLPGVQVLQAGAGNGESRVSIRGSQANQVLVVWDGVALNDPLTGEVNLSQIPLSAVQEIRVHKGSQSSRYGNGALGGVVEILPRRHMLHQVRVSGATGAFGRFAARPSVSGQIADFSFLMNADFVSEDGNYPYSYRRLDGTTVHENRRNAQFSSRNFFGRVAFASGNHFFRVQGTSFDAKRGLPGLVFSWTPYATARAKRLILAGAYEYESDRRFHKLRLSRYFNRSTFVNAPPADAPLRFRSVPAYHNSYRLISYQVALQNRFFLRNGQQPVSVRASVKTDDFRDANLLSALASPVRETKNTTVTFGVDHRFDLPKPGFLTSFFIDASARYDLFHFSNRETSRRDAQLSPAVALYLTRNSAWNWTVFANVSRAFREPTFADLFFQDFRVRGNPDLLPEKSRNLEAGVKVDMPLGGRLRLQGTYFRNRIDNLIQWELGSFATWQPFNTDALLRGSEWSLQWRGWGERVRVNASHVFLQATDASGRRTTDGKRLTYRPAHTSKLGVQLKFGTTFLRYDKRIVGSRFVTAANTIKMPAYVVDDLSFAMKHRFGKLHARLKFAVLNVLDEKYEIVENAPLPGRSWRTAVEFSY